jgi:hypothetical protein
MARASPFKKAFLLADGNSLFERFAPLVLSQRARATAQHTAGKGHTRSFDSQP